MSFNPKSCLFFSVEDLPNLIKDVVDHKEFSETNFIRAIPLFLKKMNQNEIKTELFPFIVNWINFADRTNACLFVSMLPLFMPPHYPIDMLDDLLFPLNDIIRQCAIFIEDQMMDICEIIAKNYDKSRIETLILPSLDQLFIPSILHPQGLAIRIQSYFYNLVDSSRKEKIVERLKSLADSESTYVKICVLKSIPFIVSDLKSKSPLFSELINDYVIPKFADPDYKVRAATIASSTSIGKHFFSKSQWACKFLQNVDDQSWNVRFALADQMRIAIKNSNDPILFAPVLIKLTKDSVTQIRSLSLKALTDSIKYFSEESLSEVPQIFDQGMNSQFEDIRLITIDLWASLLKHHPHAHFHKEMIGILNLLGVLPIETVTYKMMTNIVPLVKPKYVKIESLKKGFLILLNSSTPNWKYEGMSIIRLYLKKPSLVDLAKEMADNVLQNINDPSFMVRCGVGEIIVEMVKQFSWDWFLQKPFDIIKCNINNGNSDVKITISRTIIELLSINPPTEINNELLEFQKKIENDQIAAVKENAIYNHSILDLVLKNHRPRRKSFHKDSAKKKKEKVTDDDKYSYYYDEEEEEEEEEAPEVK